MNYNLNSISQKQKKKSTLHILQNLLLMIKEERKNLLLALLAILTNSGLTGGVGLWLQRRARAHVSEA